METRNCIRCGEPMRRRYKRDGSTCGWRCLSCNARQCREYKRRNADRVREQAREYYRENAHKTCEEHRKKVKDRYWLNPEKSREDARQHAAIYRTKYPERRKARNAIVREIKSGRLERQSCDVCGNPNTEAHHHKGYAREHWLDVVFLCPPHHGDADREGRYSF